jgi:catechol 2,3-dioxygenase-like lactoylglutathione lyase family enzyme
VKIKSVSGLAIYCRNLAKSAAFYESLGMEQKKQETGHVTMYSNWFWIDLRPLPKEQKAADAATGASGPLAYLSVDDVDAVYKEAKAAGMKPLSEPQDSEFGNREFAVRDPDGNQLVFFKRK